MGGSASEFTSELQNSHPICRQISGKHLSRWNLRIDRTVANDQPNSLYYGSTHQKSWSYPELPGSDNRLEESLHQRFWICVDGPRPGLFPENVGHFFDFLPRLDYSRSRSGKGQGVIKKRLACLAAVIGIGCWAIPANGHLGEEHPEGQHDYFPDFPVSDLNSQIYFRDVLNVPGSRDFEEIPDGSGRFLSINGINLAKMTWPGRANQIHYVTGGDDNIAMTEGATSLALHPGFATEGDPGYGKFYTSTIDLSRTGEPDFQSTNTSVLSHYVLTEWTQEDVSQPRFSGTSRELMRFDEGSPFHNLNHLQFGPDGFLYLAVGEDNSDSQSSDLSSVYGKILRIDPLGENSENGMYGIPEDNPFVETEDAAPEVYAYGLRNPWRMAFDRESGALFAFDVGFDSIEEVSHIEAGLNYGWPSKEGSFLSAREVLPDLPDPETGLTLAESMNLVDPIFELDHTDTNSIIGGVVYRGERFPELDGKVIFGSWNTHTIYAGDPETGGNGNHRGRSRTEGVHAKR